MKNLGLAFAAVFLFMASFSAPAKTAEPAKTVCVEHALRAEVYYGIPRGLLLSLALVESGYEGGPWPWTLNIDGKGYHLDSREDALARMVDESGDLRRNMAVGCMQIYTNYHADRFSSPERILDPRYNVWYGGWFLSDLYKRYGSWLEAVGRYHANNPDDQRAYTCRVLRHRIRLGYQTLNPAAERLCSGRYRAELTGASTAATSRQ